LPFSNLLLFRFSKDNIFEGIYYQGAINLWTEALPNFYKKVFLVPVLLKYLLP
jgi:hypothetical protein